MEEGGRRETVEGGREVRSDIRSVGLGGGTQKVENIVDRR